MIVREEAMVKTDSSALKRDARVPCDADVNQRIVESIGGCIAIVDLDGQIVHVNRRGLLLLTAGELSAVLNHPLISFFEDDALDAAEEALAAARMGRAGHFQGALRTSRGSRRWLDTVVTPIAGPNGEVAQLLAVGYDFTQRRREEVFRLAQHEMLEKIASGGALPDVLDCLARFVEELSDGMRCSVLLLDEDGETMRHGAAPSLPEEYIRAIDGIRIGPRVGSCGTAMFRGSPVFVSDILTDPLWDDYRAVARSSGLRACWSMPIFSPKREILGALAMYYTEPRTPRNEELSLIESAAHIAGIAIGQQRAHQSLRESEARNGAILRAIPEWMFLTTTDGVYLDYHARDESALYAPPSVFLGKNIRDVLPSPVGEMLGQAFLRVSESDEMESVEYALDSRGKERRYEARIVRCDGDKILTLVKDVTSRKRAELDAAMQRRELLHLSRVAVLGELTGALTHELSQPLTAVFGNAVAAQMGLERDPPDLAELRNTLEDITQSTRRATAVINRLRAMLRKEVSAAQATNLNDLVREVVDLAHSEILSRRIEVATSLSTGIPPVSGDRIQLQQLILNLVLNACDAMSEVAEDDRSLVLTTNVRDGFVQLVVTDRGVGIAEGQLENIFEPFVTFRDQGLGLGLTISRSIVSAHGGSIRAENNADGGASFRCLLPIEAGSGGGRDL
jgi:PAS domain S-box-containing protein